MRQFRLITTQPEVLGSFSLANEKLVAVHTGTGLGSHNRAWILDLESGASSLFDDVEASTYEHVRFGNSEEWDFEMKNGTLVRGFFKLIQKNM